jgi:hypothetical protein
MLHIVYQREDKVFEPPCLERKCVQWSKLDSYIGDNQNFEWYSVVSEKRLMSRALYVE